MGASLEGHELALCSTSSVLHRQKLQQPSAAAGDVMVCFAPCSPQLALQ